MRNQNQLKDILEAKRAAEQKVNKKLSLSILWNENCIGNCPIQKEHFVYNNHNPEHPSVNSEEQKVFFRSSMYSVSCYKWEKDDPSYGFKKSSIIPHKEFMEELLKAGLIFKMHGRESKNVFMNSLYIIENYIEHGIEYLQTTNEVYRLKERNKINDEKFNDWITTIKNCNFDCWKCNKCSELGKENA